MSGYEAELPEFEKFCLVAAFQARCAITSDRSGLRQFVYTSKEVLRIAAANDFDWLSQQYTIPRLHGIEEASLNWSVLMVIDHLNQFNLAALEVIYALDSGKQPMAKILQRDFEPAADVDIDVVSEFRANNREYSAFVQSQMPLAAQTKFRHPFYGNLSSHGWHLLVTSYQKNRLRQIYKLSAMLGVA